MEKKILYFGYGANRDPKMMEWITGNKNLVGTQGVLKGYRLCVQRLDQVPDSVFSTAPVNVSPKEILEESWKEDFETYIIKPDANSEVAGTIWELSSQDRELVREWELIDFGWYKDMKGKAVTKDGKEMDVQTEGLREGQGIDKEVHGKDYPPFLNKLEDFQRVAEKARREYFERQRTKEGALSLKEV